MTQSELFEDIFRRNPYEEKLRELLRATKADVRNGLQLLNSFQDDVAADIEVERRTLDSRRASLRLNSDSARAISEVQSIIEDFFDIAARRVLWSLAFFDYPLPVYVDSLNRQSEADTKCWWDLAEAMGEHTFEMILNGRIAFWTLAAKAQKQFMSEQRSALRASLGVPGAASASPPQSTTGAPPVSDSDSPRDPEPEIRERAKRRCDFVLPLLAEKRWSRRKLAEMAGVGPNTVYRFLDGTRVEMTEENRQALSDALDVNVSSLPE